MRAWNLTALSVQVRGGGTRSWTPTETLSLPGYDAIRESRIARVARLGGLQRPLLADRKGAVLGMRAFCGRAASASRLLSRTPMEALVALGILIFLVVAVAGGIAGLAKQFGRSNPNVSPPTIDPNWQPPKADPLPYSAKRYFFSAAERSFYEILKRLVSAEQTVFAKVRLADLVYVSKGAGSWQSHFNRISRKHIDFLLCDRNLAPVVAIELDDCSHDGEEREARDEFVDQVLESAGLPIVHIRAKRTYAVDQLRAELRPYLPAKARAEVPHPDERYMPPKGWRPAV